MKFQLLNIDGTKADTIEISDKLVNLKVNHKLIKFVLDWQLNHLKPRTAKTKQRNQIAGSTKKIVIKSGSQETQENEYKVIRNAANQKILVMKRREEFVSNDFLSMRQQDKSPNVLRMNHNTIQNFGDLTIRRLIATEVLIDK